MQPDPQAQHRIREPVALLVRLDQVDLLQPGQVVLRRSRRACELPGNLRQRQRLGFRQHAQNRLQDPVAARTMQPQLVREAAEVGERGSRRHLGRERLDGISSRRIHRGHGGRECADVARTSRCKRAHDPAESGRCGLVMGRVFLSQGGVDLAGGQRRQVNQLHSRGEVVQETPRAFHVAARQDEPVRALRERLDELARPAPKAGKALQRPHLEQLVEQQHRGRTRVRVPFDKRQQLVERGARGPGCGRRQGSALVSGGERRTGRHGGQKAFGGRCDALEVHVPTAPIAEPRGHPIQQERPAAAATAEQDGNACGLGVERREHPAFQCGSFPGHLRLVRRGSRNAKKTVAAVTGTRMSSSRPRARTLFHQQSGSQYSRQTRMNRAASER